MIKGWPISVLGLMSQAEGLEGLEEIKERLPRLEKLFPEAPWENFEGIDDEQWKASVEEASKLLPTPANILRLAEHLTGLPFEAKTKGQRALRFLSEMATLTPGTWADKVQKSLNAGSYSSLMQLGGADETVSDLTGMILSQFDLPKLSQAETKKGLNDLKEEAEARDVPPDEAPPGEAPPTEPSLTDKEILGKEFLTEKPLFPSLVPEDEILEKLEPILAEEFERKLKDIKLPPPPNIIEQVQKPAPVHSATALERRVGDEVSKVKFPNRSVATKRIRDEINELSATEHKEIDKLYKTSDEINGTYSEIQPEMSRNLEDLVERLSLAENPSQVEKDIVKIAQQYIRKAGTPTEGFRPIFNSELSAQIRSNNLKMSHDYIQGTPSNSYRALNQILDEAIQRTSANNSMGVEAYNRAQSAYRNWAEIFRSKEIIPWRDPGKIDLIKLLKNIENPDQIAPLDPILSRTAKGRALLGGVKRDYVERELRPFFNDPKKVDSIEFQDKIKDLSTVLPPRQRHVIEKEIINAQERIAEHDRALERYTESNVQHAKEIQDQKKKISEWNKKLNKEKKDFPYKSDSTILNDMKTVRGQKRLEEALPKTPKGKEMLDEIKDYSAVNLLTQGKINPSDKAEPLRNILNDVNKRAFLDHTLGKSITNDLREIVNNVPRVNQNVSSMREGYLSLKRMGKLVPGLRGNIASAEALYETWKMFRPAIEGSNYAMVDMELIQKIIENRRQLLGQ